MILHMKGVTCAYCGSDGIYDYEPCYKSFMATTKSAIESAERTVKKCEKMLEEQHENNCAKILCLQERITTLERLVTPFGCCQRSKP